ncbi:hypothetical protein Micbo1qcDRAFT_180643 [Microdochium bolleyi]|uniref:Uncharacterized protein n=1 Tax=Microdochium bolleyi TaxID=196109 RepID=A0A136ILD0_9PEZI|nr:hypothetical protein Micbo1qcDRAFT_180643 [Microdochium bolleyi]
MDAYKDSLRRLASVACVILRRPAHGLRHLMKFYYGRAAVFYVKTFQVAWLTDRPMNPEFEILLEAGVDKNSWDDLTQEEKDAAWAIVMAFEHERIMTPPQCFPIASSTPMVPLLDAFLQVPMPENPLTAILREFEGYRAAPHRQFLEDVTRRCGGGAGSAREFRLAFGDALSRSAADGSTPTRKGEENEDDDDDDGDSDGDNGRRLFGTTSENIMDAVTRQREALQRERDKMGSRGEEEG